jgi:hypothetical protein
MNLPLIYCYELATRIKGIFMIMSAFVQPILKNPFE